MRLAVAMVLATAAASCATTRGAQRASGAPTCKAVCDYYVGCRSIDSRETYGACVDECHEIFYEDGEADARSLRQFQRLECSEAIAFVEGSSGRPPGVSAKRREKK